MKKDALFTWLPSWRAGTPALSVTPTKPCEGFHRRQSIRQCTVNSLLRLCRSVQGGTRSSSAALRSVISVMRWSPLTACNYVASQGSQKEQAVSSER